MGTGCHCGRSISALWRNASANQSEKGVRRVNQMADDNWASYVAPNNVESRGHLMRYPVKVDQEGRVGPVRGQECFPDVGGKVLGTHSSLPCAFTT
jgi:phospholipase D1/2